MSYLDWSQVKISYPQVYLLQSQTPHTIILFQHVYWNVKHMQGCSSRGENSQHRKLVSHD